MFPCAKALETSGGDFTLSPLFSDGAVLQRAMEVPIWGCAPSGQKVRVSLQGEVLQTVARDGQWRVKFPPLSGGGPFDLLATAGDQTLRRGVYVGEVWLCSGQSNMEMPVSESDHTPDMLNPDQELHLFNVPRPPMSGPLPELAATWAPATAKTISAFSAVGYFFGRKLRHILDVPVGMLNISVGGSSIDLWVDAATKLRIAGSGTFTNGRLYDAMVRPLCPYAIRGVLWYQGESNADRSILYADYFPALIELWRGDWGQGAFPFLFVQLPGFNFYRKELPAAPQEPSTWAEVREVQARAAATVPNAAMVVTTDLGDPVLLHAPRKREIGERLAMTALGQVYGKDVASRSPVFRDMTIVGNKVRVAFDNAADGLVLQGETPTGFTICGENRVFHNANGKLDGNAVILAAPEVPNPVAVRYGWANYPQQNLFNRAGLPAGPFRTDEFPLLKCPTCQSRGGDEVKDGICSKCNVRCGIYSEHPFAIEIVEE